MFKPMLAATLKDPSKLRFPLLASPKLDGIRALVRGGRVLTRSLDPVPNIHVQALFGVHLLDGLDGELIVGKPNAANVMQATSSGVMSVNGVPDVRFWVFDHYGMGDEGLGFRLRYEGAKGVIRRGPPAVSLVAHHMIYDQAQLDDFEAKQLMLGFEGVMLRDPAGQYKHGRSTAKEGGLLKLKRFSDSEAIVIGAVEQMKNLNEAKRNALGHLERSSHKENKVGSGKLGALKVRDLTTGVEFEIGTGFTDAQRISFWLWHQGQMFSDSAKNHVPLEGQIVKYKYQPTGVKEKPRFPVFHGFRDKKDMS